MGEDQRERDKNELQPSVSLLFLCLLVQGQDRKYRQRM